MNDDKILLDAAYIKLRNNEPMSLIDLDRIIGLIERASFQLNEIKPEHVAGMQSKLITVLQKKFMQGQQQA